MTMSFKDQFRRSQLGFQDTVRERFLTFHWRLPGIVYVLYRLGVAAYTLTTLIRTIEEFDDPHKRGHPSLIWLIYLTQWTYIVLTTYFCYHALVTLAVYNSCQGLKLKLLRRMDFTEHKYLFRELYVMPTGYQQANVADDDPMDIVDRSEQNSVPASIGTSESSAADDDPMLIAPPSDTIPWYLCLVWILFNTASVFALVVTLGFWVLLSHQVPASYLISSQNIQIHLVNSVLVLVEMCLTAIPLRLLHVLYPFVYGITYAIFAVIYWAINHNNVIYGFLDFGKSPGIAAAAILIIGLVLVPFLQLLFYGIYRLKLKIFHQFCWN